MARLDATGSAVASAVRKGLGASDYGVLYDERPPAFRADVQRTQAFRSSRARPEELFGEAVADATIRDDEVSSSACAHHAFHDGGAAHDDVGPARFETGERAALRERQRGE